MARITSRLRIDRPYGVKSAKVVCDPTVIGGSRDRVGHPVGKDIRSCSTCGPNCARHGIFGATHTGSVEQMPVTLADLTNIMAKSGKVLAKPLAIDPTFPSYRLGTNLRAGVAFTPDQLLVEETENVKSRVRFRIFGDGRIQLRE